MSGAVICRTTLCGCDAIWIAQVDPLWPPVFAAWNGVDFCWRLCFSFKNPFKQSFEMVQHAIYALLHATTTSNMLFHDIVVLVRLFLRV